MTSWVPETSQQEGRTVFQQGEPGERGRGLAAGPTREDVDCSLGVGGGGALLPLSQAPPLPLSLPCSSPSYGRVYAAADPYHHTIGPAATYSIGTMVRRPGSPGPQHHNDEEGALLGPGRVEQVP
jgi:hypothetical protein